jgi:hypothetical protein
MEQVIALVATTPQRIAQLDVLRMALVCGCALALIAA